MNKETYSAKHPSASPDYKAAYDIVLALEVGNSSVYTPDHIKRFRKYIYDLSLKQNKEMATRLFNGSSLRINRLS